MAHATKRLPLKTVLCILLVVSIFLPYRQILRYDFVAFDDDTRVTKNPYVQAGLTSESIAWSFSFTEKNRTYWHPLTWISHILDCQLFELNPGMHHLTSLIIHMANSVLLFLVLAKMTGSVWRSVFVSALFALHPINVDSVAWVAERKNVLSTFFWMLTMLTYAFYTERPGLLRYLMTFLAYALGLLAKPMLVTLPFVLLLLDYWPLGRLRHPGIATAYRLFAEKIPLLVLSGISVYMSTLSLKNFGTIRSVESLPLDLRVSNALFSYISYILKMIWPQNLAVFYPYPDAVPIWKAACAAMLLIFVSLLALLVMKQKGYLTVGWFWFFGTLIPVSGLVQAGLWPAMADRWAYVPLIGLFIMITWGASDLVARWRHKNTGFAIIAATLLIALTTSTWLQARNWSDSTALFEHTLQVTKKNWVMHYALGLTLANKGRINEAIGHFSEAVKVNPNVAEAHKDFAIALAKQRNIDEAIHHYSEALRIYPGYAEAHNGLGFSLAEQGRTDEAIRHYHDALKINPGYADAHNGLGLIRAKQGRMAEAMGYFSEALRINPLFAEAHSNLGVAMMREGKIEDAIVHFQEALRIKPGLTEVNINLKTALEIRKEKTGEE